MAYRKPLAFLLAPLLLAPCVAIAAETSPPQSQRPAPAQRLLQADANGDGKVTMTEIRAVRPQFPEARFTSLDRNGDGAIEKSELSNQTAAESGTVVSRMQAADTNKDMRVSHEEFRAQFPNADETRFTKLDRNQDGFLDQLDRTSISRENTAPQGARAKAPSSGSSDEAVYVLKLIRNHDTDLDGRVTLAELTQAKHGFPTSVFGRLDRDKDGALSTVDTAVTSRGTANKTSKAAHKNATKKKTGNAKEKTNWDVNGDGTITFEEVRTANPNYTRERFDARDRNGDGVLTREDRAKN